VLPSAKGCLQDKGSEELSREEAGHHEGHPHLGGDWLEDVSGPRSIGRRAFWLYPSSGSRVSCTSATIDQGSSTAGGTAEPGEDVLNSVFARGRVSETVVRRQRGKLCV
jgi:hypothetical protein